METIQEYFERLETPAAGSPVGTLLVKMLAKNPGMSFEEARTETKALLGKAAGRKVYSVPRVFSPEERAERAEQFRAFSNLRKAA